MLTKICSFAFGILSISSVFLLIIITLRLMSVRLVILTNKVIIRKYGVLYQSLKTETRWQMFYCFLFVYRRVAMCLVYLFMSSIMNFQLMFTLYQNMVIMMFVAHIRPFITRRYNFRELVNELFVMGVTTNLILFTDFVQDASTKYDYGGWSYVALVGLCILFNLSFLVMAMLRQIRLLIIKYSNRFHIKTIQLLF